MSSSTCCGFQMQKPRKDHEPPYVTAELGWKYHHMGIPTAEKREGERYIPSCGMYVSGFPESPYGVEWMRFEKGSPVHPIVQTLPHVAFEVEDLDDAIKGLDLLGPLSAPSGGVRAAMVLHNSMPVELIEFRKTGY